MPRRHARQCAVGKLTIPTYIAPASSCSKLDWAEDGGRRMESWWILAWPALERSQVPLTSESTLPLPYGTTRH